MKKNALFFLLLSFLFVSEIDAQCTVRATVPRDTVVCGDEVIINAFGRGQGNVIFSENFNSGAPTGWAFTQQATFTNPCSPNGVDGTKHIWMGDQSGVPRSLETNPYDFSTAIAGATICFDMLFAKQGNTSPCEGPDEPQEGVYLQYKIGSGAWVTIHYFDPNGGSDPLLVNWNNWCFQLPAAALTSNVSIRWFQDNDSGAEYDHWGIDNVQIYFNDPTFTISVAAPQGSNIFSFPQGSSGGDIPPVVQRQTTTYYVTMENTSGTVCYDSITVYTRMPDLIVNAGRDTTLCEGQCVQLDAIAKVIRNPAKIVTYANSANSDITVGMGQVTNIGVNVTGLNMNTVLPNSITQVCIDNVFFFGMNIFPPQQVSIADLILTLTCPDGQTITLVPSGVTTGGNNPLSGGYTSTCFVPNGADISTGTPPYTGSWAPNQPFNNFVGCTSNGVWELNVTMNSAFGFGSGTFSGWSITFDDPESSYQGNFSWNPTTDMTGANTLSPTICPTANRAYTLTASDTANCLTLTDVVNVDVKTCCSYSIAASVTQPSCGNADGSINLNVTPAGNYSYSWSDGNSSANRTNLNAGVYKVTITDITNNNCEQDTVFVLSNSGAPMVTYTVKNESCDGADGSITLAASGGTGTYTYDWNTSASGDSIGGLVAGTYSYTVTDKGACKATGVVTVSKETNCCKLEATASATPQSCGVEDGTIEVTVVSGGTAPYTYSINGINYQSSNTFAGLAGDSYTIYVLDNAGCSDTFNVTVPAASGTLEVDFDVTNPSCVGVADGEIVANVSGGTPNYTYDWSVSGKTAGNKLTDLADGTYTLTVTDDAGCKFIGSVTLDGAQSFSVSLGNDTGFCVGSSITLSAPSGYQDYAWSSGTTSESIQIDNAGEYSITVTNASGCSASATVNITVYQNPEITLPSDTTIFENNPITLTPEVVGGGNGQYSWTPEQNISCVDCAAPEVNPHDSVVYTVHYTDENNCPASTSIVVHVVKGGAVILPNAFSPNGDGKNDVLKLLGNNVKTVKWKVYNRWGELVFKSNDFNSGWDGTYKGKAQPTGVYVYTIDVTFMDKRNEHYNGNVNIVR